LPSCCHPRRGSAVATAVVATVAVVVAFAFAFAFALASEVERGFSPASKDSAKRTPLPKAGVKAKPERLDIAYAVVLRNPALTKICIK
jgi:hypothetical protein